MARRKHEFYRGAALSSDRFVALAGRAGASGSAAYQGPTVFALFDIRTGTWEEIARRDWFGCAVCSAGGDDGFVVLGTFGEVYVSSDPEPDGRVVPHLSSIPFNAVTRIDGHLVATSGAGQHMVRPTADGTWAPLAPQDYDDQYLRMSISEQFARIAGLASVEDADELSGDDEIAVIRRQGYVNESILAVGGSSLSDLTLGGQNGRLIHFDGERLRDVEEPTLSSITDIVPFGDDVLMVGAHRGSVLLRGHPDRGFAKLFERPNTEIWAGTLALDGDAVLIGDPVDATGGLWRYADERLERVAEVSDPVWQVEHVGGVTWALHKDGISRFDGTRWTRFDGP